MDHHGHASFDQGGYHDGGHHHDGGSHHNGRHHRGGQDHGGQDPITESVVFLDYGTTNRGHHSLPLPCTVQQYDWSLCQKACLYILSALSLIAIFAFIIYDWTHHLLDP